MEIPAEYLITALILPLYPLLFMIMRKIGRYDEVCKDVEALEADVKELWKRANGVKE